jgi:hypothetical protein
MIYLCFSLLFLYSEWTVSVFFDFLVEHKYSWQVMQFLESPEYSMFTRIVFDTAPTVSLSTRISVNFWNESTEVHDCSLQGHTLRLLSLPDFLDASIGKILKVETPS